ncbi:MAG TPA: acyl carrier protein [Syntrophomonadaceae bacterium]|mgnify:FL=1|nr:acyl carrier protein [Syntrophomonadaceae bacterium]
MEDFYTELAEILEVDEVKREDELEDFENWDSLTILEVASMVDEKYGVTIASKEVKGLITVGDLEDLIRSKM